MFSCSSNGTNTIVRSFDEFNFKAVTLLSPCYPDNYRTCDYSKACYIRLNDVPSNTWIGVYIDEVSPVSISDDRLELRYSDNNWTRYFLRSAKQGLLYHVYQDNQESETLGCLFVHTPEALTTPDTLVGKLKIDIKCEYVELGGNWFNKNNVSNKNH